MRIKSAVIVFVAGFAGPAWSHHSFAMFDADKTVTMTGTVKQFEWSNPHSWLRMIVQDQTTGKPVEWMLELGSPVQQERVGWTRDSLKPGDKVTVTMHPVTAGLRTIITQPRRQTCRHFD